MEARNKSYSEIKDNYDERLSSIQEEIKTFMNIDSEIIANCLIVQTVAGVMKYQPSEKTLMGDVYRLINHYGSKISKWGLDNKINENHNHTNKKAKMKNKIIGISEVHLAELEHQDSIRNKNLWGNILYSFFRKHIDRYGWLTYDWATIIEDNVKDWDKDFNEDVKKKALFSNMYSIEFEESPDRMFVRPKTSRHTISSNPIII